MLSCHWRGDLYKSLASNDDFDLSVSGAPFLFFDVFKSLIGEDSGCVAGYASFCTSLNGS